MDLLWPDLGKRAASNNLRQVLYGALRILDPASDSHTATTQMANRMPSLRFRLGGKVKRLDNLAWRLPPS
jgi:DNA-binding SARP family transcriptional activator